MYLLCANIYFKLYKNHETYELLITIILIFLHDQSSCLPTVLYSKLVQSTVDNTCDGRQAVVKFFQVHTEKFQRKVSLCLEIL